MAIIECNHQTRCCMLPSCERLNEHLSLGLGHWLWLFEKSGWAKSQVRPTFWLGLAWPTFGLAWPGFGFQAKASTALFLTILTTRSVERLVCLFLKFLHSCLLIPPTVCMLYIIRLLALLLELSSHLPRLYPPVHRTKVVPDLQPLHFTL